MATTILTGTAVSSSVTSTGSFGALKVVAAEDGTTITTDRFGLKIDGQVGFYPLTVQSPYETAARFLSTDGTANIEIGDNSSTQNHNRIQVVGDVMELVAANSKRVELSSGAIVFNQDSDDVNFRIESNNDQHMLSIDGGKDKIAIGSDIFGDDKMLVAGNLGVTGSLHVSGNISTSGSIIAKEFRTEFVNQIIATSSGSTTFGDSIDDVHHFTGSMRVSSSIRVPDGAAVQAGVAGDVSMFHNGTDSFLSNSTGHLVLEQNANDKDIILKSDDGSGGSTAYITLDGSAERIQFSKKALIDDNVKFEFGSGADLQVYHNGTNSYINNTTGDLHISSSASDKDIRFSVNDGGSVKDFMFMDSSNMTLQMLNSTISGVNLLQFNDPGAGEGISWSGGSWSVFVSGDDMSNTNGNLQFVSGSSGAGRTNGHIAMRGHSEATLSSLVKTQLYMPSSSLEIGNASAAGANVANDARVNIVSEGNERTLKLTANNEGTNGSYTVSMLMQGYEDRGNGIFMTDTGTSGMEWFTGLPYQHNGRYYQIGADDGGLAEYRTSASIQIDYTDKWVGIGNGVTGYDLFVFNGNISGSMTSTGSFGAIHMPSTARIGFGTTTPAQAIDLRDGRIIMNNNYGYVQRDASGNSATVVNQNGSDQLIVGDTNHTDEVLIKSANSRTYIQGNSDTAEFGLRESNNTLRFFMKYDSGTVLDSDSTLIMRANNTSGAQIKINNSVADGIEVLGSVSASITSTGSFGALQIADNGNSFTLGSHAGKARMTYTGAHFNFLDADNSYGSIAVDSGSFNGSIFIRPTLKLYFDGAGGGPYTAGHTYISETASDRLDFYVGGDLLFRIDEAATIVGMPADSDQATFRIGAGSDLGLYVNTDDNAVIRNFTSDKDLYFTVNDGGSAVNAVQIDASDGGTALFSHDILLNTELGAIRFGTSQQGSIYEHASDIVISNSAAGNDTIFENLNSDGSSYVKNLFIDGSTSRIGIGTTTPGVKLEVIGDVSSSIGTTGSFNHLQLGKKASNFASAAPNLRLATDGATQQKLASYDTNYYNHGYHTVENKTSNSTQLCHYGYYGHTFSTQAVEEALVVSRSGDVGIGNPKPTEPLVVEGVVSGSTFRSKNGTFDSQNASTNLKLRRGTNDDDIIEIHASETRIIGDAVERCKIGSYGIKVHKDADAGGASGYGLHVGAGDDLFIGHNGTNSFITNKTGDLYVSQSVSNKDIIFMTNDGGNIETPFKIQGSTGNILIAQPSKFVFANGQTIYDNGGGGLALNGGSHDLDLIGGTDNGGDTRFFVNGTTTTNQEKMNLRNSGRFEVSSSMAIKDTLYIAQGGSDYSPNISFMGGTDTAGVNDYENAIIGYYDNSGTGNMLFKGNRGAMNWHFNDDGDSLFLMASSGDFHADGDVIAASTTTSSDIRLKKNINDIPYGLGEVLQLRGVEFDWKEKRDGKHDIGVIAQEIEKIIPEVVQESKDLNSDTMYKSVDYGKLTAILIKAVQEQQEQIKELKEDINKLQGHK